MLKGKSGQKDCVVDLPGGDVAKGERGKRRSGTNRKGNDTGLVVHTGRC